jgi:hypothetical protein
MNEYSGREKYGPVPAGAVIFAPFFLFPRSNSKLRASSLPRHPARLLLWVTCGQRRGKDLLTLLQHWSGAVTCPAFHAAGGRWP